MHLRSFWQTTVALHGVFSRTNNYWDCPQANCQTKLAKGKTLRNRSDQKLTSDKRPNTGVVGIFNCFNKTIVVVPLRRLGKSAGIEEQAAYSQRIACAPVSAAT